MIRMLCPHVSTLRDGCVGGPKATSSLVLPVEAGRGGCARQHFWRCSVVYCWSRLWAWWALWDEWETGVVSSLAAPHMYCPIRNLFSVPPESGSGSGILLQQKQGGSSHAFLNR